MSALVYRITEVLSALFLDPPIATNLLVKATIQLRVGDGNRTHDENLEGYYPPKRGY